MREKRYFLDSLGNALESVDSWEKTDLVALSIYATSLVLENFENVFPDDKRPRQAIQAARKWQKNPTTKNQSAAESAAESAQEGGGNRWCIEESTAWNAGMSSACSAWCAAKPARNAAWSARSAVWCAVSGASRSVEQAKVGKKIEAWIKRRIKTLEEEK